MLSVLLQVKHAFSTVLEKGGFLFQGTVITYAMLKHTTIWTWWQNAIGHISDSYKRYTLYFKILSSLKYRCQKNQMTGITSFCFCCSQFCCNSKPVMQILHISQGPLRFVLLSPVLVSPRSTISFTSSNFLLGLKKRGCYFSGLSTIKSFSRKSQHSLLSFMAKSQTNCLTTLTQRQWQNYT